MKITILTLFPQMFQGPFDYSILKHAQQKGLVEIEYSNIRDFGLGKHQVVDDTPYGGGTGMILRVDVLHKAIQQAREKTPGQITKVFYLGAHGKTFSQVKAKELAKLEHMILLCGHYEGVDERIKKYIDEEVSVGNFILTGGEIPAMLIVDAVVRLKEGVLKPGVTDNESFSLSTGEENEKYLLEYSQFTKPAMYEGENVPEVLISGNHEKIANWRKENALTKTENTKDS